MKCQHGIHHQTMEQKVGLFMRMEQTPTEDKEPKVKDSKQPDRGSFGWDNIDVVI
jgi:hypothetical protein